MVGDEGIAGTAAARLTRAVQAAYDAAARDWDGGPGRMYGELARALIAKAGASVSGSRVLDLGAGTGAAGAAALCAGATQVVAADIAPGMLARCPAPLHPVAADAVALPFRDGSFDLAVAAFCLGHLSCLQSCLAEVRRVCAALAASAFAPGWNHPAKQAVDDVLADYGYHAPGWYLRFKEETEPRVNDPDMLATQAAAAGFTGVDIRTVAVTAAMTAPAQLVSWRLGMAHIAPFAASLGPSRHAELLQAAEAAVAKAGSGSLKVEMLVLTGRSGN
jgi:ubiquinone/menaquinone biosynthesis C-methylase UbiE